MSKLRANDETATALVHRGNVVGWMVVHILCDVCDASFAKEDDYEAHRASEHVLPQRQPYGHR